MSFFDAHSERLQRAVEANRIRGYWSPFIESPSRRFHPEGARLQGKARFESWMHDRFALEQRGASVTAPEVSPWTGEPLGIQYPEFGIDRSMAAALSAMDAFAASRPEARVGVCLEILDRLAADAFTNAYATMHTAGQPFLMAFAGSGANSLDRGLEATARAWSVMDEVPFAASFERSFGKDLVQLEKRYRIVPRGVTVVFSCATYPAWNAYPAVMASLATGNPVVLKPHPSAVVPMARAVQIGRAVLTEAGFSPDLLTLAVDPPDRLIGLELVDHQSVATVDFTGSQGFGALLEQRCRGKRVYTETAGCNAVVLDSSHDLEATLHAVAHSFCIFSSQMCTAAQNVFVPESGVQTPEGRVPAEEVEERLVQRIDRLVASERVADLCGAIQAPSTVAQLSEFGDVLRASEPLGYPDWPGARAASPVLVRGAGELHRREHFGPIGFAVRVANAEEGLAQATRDAKECGSIASYVYSTREPFIEAAENAFAHAGASVGINLHRQLPINYAAAYSDFHVTGLNPAGTACLTDVAFVADRFRIVQSKREIEA